MEEHSNEGSSQFTEAQKERLERNRERARALRQARLAAAPYVKRRKHEESHITSSSSSCPPPRSHYDSRGGYFMEDEEKTERHKYRRVEEDAPAFLDEQMLCEECKKRFVESFLQSKFQLDVCDQCREPDGKHKLISKTEAKQRFLLKDCDFEERDGPPLPFLLQRNPHSSRWGDMKLFLLCQVEARSHSIWGGQEGLDAEHLRKGELREKKKETRYAKEIKELRRAVHSSMIQTTSKSHEHNFPVGGEIYNSDSDTWTKTCTDCDYKVTFEKM